MPALSSAMIERGTQTEVNDSDVASSVKRDIVRLEVPVDDGA